ncbi:TPA: hypothetical protein PXA49_002087, partial [Mannheimia haemolytica]|nr:hypothetical protein [Mannheimia haemolytica]HDV6781220.1 hypothetical protein [Mannheimia haemolytica]
IDEKYRESFHCEAVKWIIEYLKEKNTLPAQDILEDNADYDIHYTDGDYLHIFNDDSAISIYDFEKYIHISPKSENVEDYMIFGIDFNNKIPFVFLLKELFINNQERKRLLQEKEVELKKTMNKFMKLEMKKTNQGKKKKRELKERIDTLSLEIDKYMKSSYAEYLETLK